MMQYGPDEQTDRWMCLCVCSYVLVMLEVVNLARNMEHYGAMNLDIARRASRWILEWERSN